VALTVALGGALTAVRPNETNSTAVTVLSGKVGWAYTTSRARPPVTAGADTLGVVLIRLHGLSVPAAVIRRGALFAHRVLDCVVRTCPTVGGGIEVGTARFAGISMPRVAASA
jgi:hypothetical protein